MFSFEDGFLYGGSSLKMLWYRGSLLSASIRSSSISSHVKIAPGGTTTWRAVGKFTSLSFGQREMDIFKSKMTPLCLCLCLCMCLCLCLCGVFLGKWETPTLYPFTWKSAGGPQTTPSLSPTSKGGRCSGMTIVPLGLW